MRQFDVDMDNESTYTFLCSAAPDTEIRDALHTIDDDGNRNKGIQLSGGAEMSALNFEYSGVLNESKRIC